MRARKAIVATAIAICSVVAPITTAGAVSDEGSWSLVRPVAGCHLITATYFGQCYGSGGIMNTHRKRWPTSGYAAYGKGFLVWRGFIWEVPIVWWDGRIPGGIG